MHSIWQHLQRRRFVRWSAAYLAGAWALLEVLDFLQEQFAWPAALLRAATGLLAVGFLGALVLAWFHGEKGGQRVRGVELALLGLILIAAVSAAAFAGRLPVEPSRTAPDPDPAEQGSVAVLPFVNLSDSKENEYFSDGLTEELLNTLARVEGLRVPGRTSSFQYQGRSENVRVIARELGVAAVLEGSVRRAGSSVRISAQLIDGERGYQIWSQTYDRELRDIFAVQEELARAITAALDVRLTSEMGARIAERPTHDVAAYDLYLKGRHDLQVRDEPAVRRAIDYFNQALQRDPGYAGAYAGLTHAYIYLAEHIPPTEALPRAKAAALRALELDERLAETHMALAEVRWRYDWDWAAAERGFRRAIELEPRSASAHRAYADFLSTARRPADGLRELRLALDLERGEVRDSVAFAIREHNALATHYLYAHQPDTGLAHLRAVAALDSTKLSRWMLGLTYMQKGLYPEAVAELERVRTAMGDRLPYLTHLGVAYAGAGRQSEARAILAELHRRADTTYVPRDQFAALHLGLGERDSAIAALNRAAEERHWWLVHANVTPFFEPLRPDPRFQAFLERIGVARAPTSERAEADARAPEPKRPG